MAGTIESCHDGDTCAVLEDGKALKIRIYCIDAPGLDVRPWGDMARDAINEALPRGAHVRIVRHATTAETIIGELIRDDGTNAGLELVRAGLVSVAPRYCRDNAYYRAEEDAATAGRGLWQPAKE